MTPGTTARDTAYLDIETDWDRQITVIGIHHEVRGTVQLVRPDITREGLLSARPSTSPASTATAKA